MNSTVSGLITAVIFDWQQRNSKWNVTLRDIDKRTTLFLKIILNSKNWYLIKSKLYFLFQRLCYLFDEKQYGRWSLSHSMTISVILNYADEFYLMAVIIVNLNSVVHDKLKWVDKINKSKQSTNTKFYTKCCQLFHALCKS